MAGWLSCFFIYILLECVIAGFIPRLSQIYKKYKNVSLVVIATMGVEFIRGMIIVYVLLTALCMLFIPHARF